MIQARGFVVSSQADSTGARPHERGEREMSRRDIILTQRGLELANCAEEKEEIVVEKWLTNVGCSGT